MRNAQIKYINKKNIMMMMLYNILYYKVLKQ